MKFSKYISKAVTPVMALFQKQHGCLSNKATTICGHSAQNLRQVPGRHHRRGKSTENKVRFAPPTMCRLTIVIKRMMNGDARWNEFEIQLETLMDKYSDVVKLSFMGFPNEWKKLLK